jgi:UDP-glucose 4-epimerase
LNAEATIRLAQAAHRAGAKRFVFLSSIRAQCGPSAEGLVTEDLPPNPTDAYGRSKLAAEQGLASVDLDWVALRPVLVYGPGVKGNMARLMRLARSRLPLPLGGLHGRRSLLSVGNLVDAVDTVLAVQQPLRRPLLVADRAPLTISEMVGAMRAGLGRRGGLVRVPPSFIRSVCRLAGQEEVFDRMAGSLVADSAAMRALNWNPKVDTPAGLAALMRG